MEPAKATQCIVHIDMDAFYAQVEARRHKIPPNEPVAVRQWNFIIAANYAAKSQGVNRGMYCKEAKEKLPTLHLVHVDTIAPDNTYREYEKNSTALPDRQTEKVSLKRYRDESKKIIEVFEKYCKIVEKASIDEAFLDLTEEAELLLIGIEDDASFFDKDLWKGKMVGEAFAPVERHDRLLAITSHLAEEIRKAVFNEFGYTCSAGISHNKLLAKLASALNKPNGQTVVPLVYASATMEPIMIKKIRNFGGNVARTCDEIGIKTVSELKKLSLEELQDLFGEKEYAKWIYDRARGIDYEEIKPKKKPKSMDAVKTFKAVKTFEELIPIIKILCIELRERISTAYDQYQIYPAVLSHSEDRKSKAIEMLEKDKIFDKENGIIVFQEYLLKQYEKLKTSIIPATWLAIGARNFKEIEVKQASKNATLERFFAPISEEERKRKATVPASVHTSKRPKLDPRGDIRSYFVSAKK